MALVMVFAVRFGKNWAAARSTYQQVRPTTAQVVASGVISWSRPQVGYVKCDVDTAFSEDRQHVGYELVVRDKEGAFIRAVISHLPVVARTTVDEVMAIREALLFKSL
ncbi:hypothetical protein V6Z12_D08G210900 [Gossypium hirsutum]|nr:hypothetical protein GOBAR_DD03491 [Gossypium barbadense]